MGFKGGGICILGGFNSTFRTPSLNYPDKPLPENACQCQEKYIPAQQNEFFRPYAISRCNWSACFRPIANLKPKYDR